MSISFCFDQPPYLYYLLNRNSFVPNWNMFSNLHFYLYSCCNIPSLSFCNGTKVNTSILKWAKFGHNLLCQIWGLCSSPSYSIEGAFRFTTNVVRFASPSTCVTTHDYVACPCNDKTMRWVKFIHVLLVLHLLMNIKGNI
jgi:hypothetical protein